MYKDKLLWRSEEVALWQRGEDDGDENCQADAPDLALEDDLVLNEADGFFHDPGIVLEDFLHDRLLLVAVIPWLILD